MALVPLPGALMAWDYHYRCDSGMDQSESGPGISTWKVACYCILLREAVTSSVACAIEERVGFWIQPLRTTTVLPFRYSLICALCEPNSVRRGLSFVILEGTTQRCS